jgi:hypothetical protein
MPSSGASQVQYFYANLVFEVSDGFEHLKEYLRNTQNEYVERRIYKTYELIDEGVPPGLSFEEMLHHINVRGNDPESFYTGWDFNPNHGWFTRISKFDCWRFHEYFTDNAITRALFQQIQNVAYNVPSSNRSTPESELISCFESLKQWWD